MKFLLCRNTVRDYDKWYAVFSSHKEAHREAGLVLEQVWRSADDPDNVFFSFRVEDVERARAFLNAPESEDAGEAAGVLEGEYYFVESTESY